MNLKGIIEGILFAVGDEGISLTDLIKILDKEPEEIKNTLMELKNDYESDDRGIRITFLGNSFKLTTKKEHKEFFEKLLVDTKTYTLSDAALEVLAIIAYNEPVTRLKVDEIRGVNSSNMIRKLVAMNFIKECGKADTIGRPNLYKTTNDFLDYFGLATKEDLPKLVIKQEIENEDKDLYTSTYKENV